MFQPNDSLGPYTLLQFLGGGSFGVVWKAEKQKREDNIVLPCAIKLPLDPDIKWADVEKEARVWLQASGHPNIVPLIEADVYDGHIVLVSEYIEGGSLLGWLRQNDGKAPSVKDAIDMMTGILVGLQHLHTREKQIIHRDLKPANILLQHGIPRLADFGLSRLLSTDPGSGPAGTLAYMSPEALDGKREPAVDIWAAGVILYELLTGRLPFPQRQQGPLINAIFKEPPAPLPSDLPEPLRAIVLCALEKDLAKRYKTATAMREALLRVNLTPQPQPHPGLIGQEKRMTAKAVLADLPGVLAEIAQRHTVFIIEVDDPGGRGKDEFVLAPEAVGKRVLGLVNKEYEWPKVVEAEQVRAIGALAPGVRDHPFVRWHNECVAVGVRLREYEKSKQRWPNWRKQVAAVVAGIVLLSLGIGIGSWNPFRSEPDEYTVTLTPTATPAATVTATPAATPATPEPTPTPAASPIGTGIPMRRVPGGTFQMGSPTSEQGRSDAEGPPHQVTVPDFHMSKYEITQAQWKAVMGTDPSNFKGDDLPVENVSWNEAKEFCQKLSRQTGKNYRLPTEAEWEYACRARTTTPFAFGSSLSSEQANFNGEYPYGNAPKGVYRGKTMRVGSFKENKFGLYDMHGNVWEWCEDVWHDSYNGAPSDGSAWLSGGDSSLRVLRGGSWSSNGDACRAASRDWNAPGDRDDNVGFRVVVAARTR